MYWSIYALFVSNNVQMFIKLILPQYENYKIIT